MRGSGGAKDGLGECNSQFYNHGIIVLNLRNNRFTITVLRMICCCMITCMQHARARVVCVCKCECVCVRARVRRPNVTC